MNGLLIRKAYPDLQMPVNNVLFSETIIENYLDLVDHSIMSLVDYNYYVSSLPELEDFTNDGDYDDMIAEITAVEYYGESFGSLHIQDDDREQWYENQYEVQTIFDEDLVKILCHFNLAYFNNWNSEFVNLPITEVW